MLGAWALTAMLALLGDEPAPKPKAPSEATVKLPATEQSPEDESQAQLATIRRIYVDILTGGEDALKFRDVIMSSLQQSKLFIITEDESRADAILKGAADDTVFTDYHDTSDNLNVHTQSSNSDGFNNRYSGSKKAQATGLSLGENEASHIEERQHEAFAAVRLVNRDGDVIWSSAQESLGGKYVGATADVAARIAKQLATDYRQARARKIALPKQP